LIGDERLFSERRNQNLLISLMSLLHSSVVTNLFSGEIRHLSDLKKALKYQMLGRFEEQVEKPCSDSSEMLLYGTNCCTCFVTHIRFDR
jgi:hypothetical protein